MSKQKAIWVECRGEAHSNGFIDNCYICMPYWHFYPTCPECGKKLKESGFCKVCKKYRDLEKENL